MKWNVGQVTEMAFMFSAATAFNGDISNWNVGKVTSMNRMFHSAKAFKRTLCGAWPEALKRSKTDAYYMFAGSSGKIGDAATCRAFPLPLSPHPCLPIHLCVSVSASA